METLNLIIKNNPGFINIALTSVLLPLLILYLTNKNNRKIKFMEKDLQLGFNSKEDIRKQEKIVYSSLSKILFDVQQLYVALSGVCIDNDCIINAIAKFDSSINKYHDDISSNMLYLPSDVINAIYKFYNQVGALKIELKELNESKKYDFAHVSVYYFSQNLADVVIDIQEMFIKERTDLKVQFDRARQEMMKYCCGTEPPANLKLEYNRLKETLLNRQIPLIS